MKRKPPDMVLFFLVFILLAIGIVMVFSASAGIALDFTHAHPDPYYFLKRQILWLCAGFAGMLFAYRIEMDALRRYTPWLFLAATISLGVVLFPGIGMEANGSRRWFHLSLLNIQPAELSKIVLVLFVAWFLTRKGSVSTSFTKSIVPILCFTLPMIALVFKEPDFGTAFLMFVIVVAMLCMGGMRVEHLLFLAGAAAPPGILLMLAKRYRLSRWIAFFHPWKDPFGAGYHIIQGLIALGSGGLWGLGLGASRQKFFYLPEQHTDYIFAVLGEEGGFLAAFFLLLLFLFIAARGLNIALEQKDLYRKILAGGLTVCIVGQAFMNMAMVMKLIPPVGIALPFLSYGGSSLISSMIAAGLLLNLSRKEPDRRIDYNSTAFGLLAE